MDALIPGEGGRPSVVVNGLGDAINVAMERNEQV